MMEVGIETNSAARPGRARVPIGASGARGFGYRETAEGQAGKRALLVES